MALTILNNQMSLTAQRSLNKSGSALSTAMERLSSGLRINSAKDDAAGLAIADRMTSSIRGLNQAVRNANDGISLAQTAEGALQETTNILQRMRELAVQSANDTNTGSDRTSLQKEVSQLQQELNRIANTTSFNGKTLLDGTFSAQQFQVGANASQTIAVSVGNAQATSLGAHQVDSAATVYTVTATSGNNITASGTLSINGYVGSQDVDYAVGATARDTAAGVNGVTSDTGVTARAYTDAGIQVTATGSISFALEGQNENTATTASKAVISVSVTDTSDLTEFAAAVNDKSGTTGVTATLSADKATLYLKNADGYDIQLTGQAGTTGAVTVDGVDTDGTTLLGATQTIAAAATGDISVGGKVTFESSKSFSVVDNAAMYSASTTSSTLSKVSDIDISSQKGSNDALSTIDKALAYVDDLRADLGAVQNRFTSTISNLQTSSDNISDARSRIQDADFAAETSQSSKMQILQQSGIAMIVQSNSVSQLVLSLLR